MGRDKALLPFLGKPLVEIAVEKLRTFCPDVSIAGNREDLEPYAPIAHETRTGIGPGAGLEAALLASRQPWILMIPVDVPLVPADLLERWVREIIQNPGFCGSFLITNGVPQPAFALLHQRCTGAVTASLDAREQRLTSLLYAADGADLGVMYAMNVNQFAPGATEREIEFWFSNLNTPQEFAEAERWARDPENHR
jgi:molybdopterin-guanine dinucleotide biosynthesis protein A